MDLAKLRQILIERYGKGELRALCFDLGIDPDNLPAVGKADKATELVKYLERRDRIPDLVEIGKQQRTDIPWGDILEGPAGAATTPLISKTEKAPRLRGRRLSFVLIVLTLLTLSAAVLLGGGALWVICSNLGRTLTPVSTQALTWMAAETLAPNNTPTATSTLTDTPALVSKFPTSTSIPPPRVTNTLTLAPSTPTSTSTRTPTPTPTNTSTPTPTPTNTRTPMPTPTNAPIPEPTETHTPTPIPAPTNTPSPTPTPTLTYTPTPPPTPTPQVVASKLVVLKTWHNKYVTALGGDWDWILRAERDESTGVSLYERFTLLCLDNGKIALRTHHDKYVTAQETYVAAQDIPVAVPDIPDAAVAAQGEHLDWILRAETSHRLAYEEFTVVEPNTWEQLPCWAVEQLPCLEMFKRLEAGEVKIALKTHHNRYVTAQGADWKWILMAEREESKGVDLFEGFTVIPQ